MLCFLDTAPESFEIHFDREPLCSVSCVKRVRVHASRSALFSSQVKLAPTQTLIPRVLNVDYAPTWVIAGGLVFLTGVYVFRDNLFCVHAPLLTSSFCV